MTPMNFPVTMEDVCQMISSVITIIIVETTVMKTDVVCMWCEIWFNDPALIYKEVAYYKNPALINHSGIVIVC